MPLTCRVCQKTNPKGAAYCYNDGTPLSSKLGKGPIHMGTLEFPRPFNFSNGKSCSNFNQLAHACTENWEEARAFLRDGLWPPFFGGMGRLDLASAAQQAAQQPDADLALSEMLEKLPADVNFLRPAELSVQSKEEDLGKLSPGVDKKFELVIINRGMLVLHGIAWSECPWLIFGERAGPSEKAFQTRDFFTIPVRVDGSRLRAGRMPLKAEIVIDSNGGTIKVPVTAEVPICPFPSGVFDNDSLAGATSPKELALKAKENPKEASVLFEKGAVKFWYQSNGWDYPIEGSEGMGRGAVQQFFEALGLTKPPKLDMEPKFLVFQGRTGQHLHKLVTIKTEEPRAVYAEGWSGLDWVTFGKTMYLGKKVRIPVQVVIPPIPGETVQAQVTIRGNGNQQFNLPINVSVEQGPPVTNPDDAGRNALLRWGLIAGGACLVLLLAAVVLAFTVFLPRQQTPVDPNPPFVQKVKFDTPKKAFDALIAAATNGKHEDSARCLSDQSKDALTGLFVLSAGLLKDQKKGKMNDLDAAVANHPDANAAMRTDDLRRALQNLEMYKDNDFHVRMILGKLVEPLNDKGKFLDNMLKAARPVIIARGATLANLREMDAKAIAKIVTGAEPSQPIAFVKSVDGWSVELSEPTLWSIAGQLRVASDAKPSPIPIDVERFAVLDNQVNLMEPADALDKQPSKTFKLQMKKGDTCTFDLESRDSAPKLRLEFPSGKHVQAEQDGRNAIIRDFEAPEDGEYKIVASAPIRWARSFSLGLTRTVNVAPLPWMDAQFGDWSIWRKDDRNTIVLLDRKAGRAVELPLTPAPALVNNPGNFVKYKDDIGRTRLITPSDLLIPTNSPIDDTLIVRERPEKNLVPGATYEMGKNWSVRVIGTNRVQFRPIGIKNVGTLLVSRSSEEFNYNGRVYKLPGELQAPQSSTNNGALPDAGGPGGFRPPGAGGFNPFDPGAGGGAPPGDGGFPAGGGGFGPGSPAGGLPPTVRDGRNSRIQGVFKKLIDKLDKNMDGKLSKDELTGSLGFGNSLLQRADKNGDNIVDEAELYQLFGNLGRKGARDGRPGGGGGVPGGPVAPPGGGFEEPGGFVPPMGLGGAGIGGRSYARENLEANYQLDPWTRSPCRIFKIRLLRGNNYRINLSSSYFNSYLRLEDAEGRQIKTDDNSGGGLSARIVHEVSRTADYRIIVTKSGGAGGAGNFFLNVIIEPPLPLIYLPVTKRDSRDPKYVMDQNYFLDNGAKLGNWSIWTGPFGNRRGREAFLLYHNRTRQAIYVRYASGGWILHRDTSGAWYNIFSKKMKTKDTTAGQRLYNSVVAAKQPKRQFANVDGFTVGKWTMSVSAKQIEFHNKASLIIRPFDEEFTFNGKKYGGKSAGVIKGAAAK